MYNITQTVVTTAFCRFLRKKLRPRATSASTFPSPSLPSYFRQKKIALDRRYPSVANSKRSRLFSCARIRALVARLPCDGGRRSFVFLIAFVSLFSLFLLFFPLRPKIVGRRTRVIGQGSKTWKGYRNSLFPPFLFILFIIRSHLFASLFSSPVLPLSFSSLLTALGEKKK